MALLGRLPDRIQLGCVRLNRTRFPGSEGQGRHVGRISGLEFYRLQFRLLPWRPGQDVRDAPLAGARGMIRLGPLGCLGGKFNYSTCSGRDLHYRHGTEAL